MYALAFNDALTVVIDLFMDNFRVAICVIAYNEEQNIENLITKIIGEKIQKMSLFIYTDGSTDETADIVDKLEKKHHEAITHIRGGYRNGKHRAYNSLLSRIKGYKYTIFLDGDVDIKKGSLVKLLNYLISDNTLAIVAPLLEPQTKGLGELESKVSTIYRKVKKHIAKYQRYRYFTGRNFAAITNRLPVIPERSYEDDFYLNLQFESEEIGVCKRAVVGYFMPSSFWGMYWYSYRIGNSLCDMKTKFPGLWSKQTARIPLVDYAIFGLTKYKFGEFCSQLTFSEILIFLYSRKATALGFYLGFLTKRKNSIWEPIMETKKSF